MKKAGSLIGGKRWSFFHGPGLDPLTGTVLLSHPGPVQMCCLHLRSARFPLTRAEIHVIFSLSLSLSPFASPLLCSDKVCCALPVRAQKKTSSLQFRDRGPWVQVLSLGEGSSVPSTSNQHCWKQSQPKAVVQWYIEYNTSATPPVPEFQMPPRDE